jgi:hypothetical protein
LNEREFSQLGEAGTLIIIEKEVGTSLYLRGLNVAGSIESISRSVNFCARLKGNPPYPLKMTLMMFFGFSKS